MPAVQTKFCIPNKRQNKLNSNSNWKMSLRPSGGFLLGSLALAWALALAGALSTGNEMLLTSESEAAAYLELENLLEGGQDLELQVGLMSEQLHGQSAGAGQAAESSGQAEARARRLELLHTIVSMARLASEGLHEGQFPKLGEHFGERLQVVERALGLELVQCNQLVARLYERALGAAGQAAAGPSKKSQSEEAPSFWRHALGWLGL